MLDPLSHGSGAVFSGQASGGLSGWAEFCHPKRRARVIHMKMDVNKEKGKKWTNIEINWEGAAQSNQNIVKREYAIPQQDQLISVDWYSITVDEKRTPINIIYSFGPWKGPTKAFAWGAS